MQLHWVESGPRRRLFDCADLAQPILWRAGLACECSWEAVPFKALGRRAPLQVFVWSGNVQGVVGGCCAGLGHCIFCLARAAFCLQLVRGLMQNTLRGA